MRFKSISRLMLVWAGITASGGGVMGSSVELLKNIQTTVGASLDPKDFCQMGALVFFSAATAGQGRELWRTDGTEAGTWLVRDIVPGMVSSNPRDMVVSGGRLFFTADDGGGDLRLWVSDGTADGTRMASALDPSGVLPLKKGVIFSDGASDSVYYSDGTEGGTRMLRDFHSSGSHLDYPDWVVSGNRLFFRLYSSQGRELWRSDGTASGTRRVRLLEPGVSYSDVSGMVVLGGTAFFASNDDNSGVELWKSNGTSSGTKRVKDLIPGEQGSYPAQFTVFNGQVFFTALNENGTRGIWRTDGTAAGTVRVVGVPGEGAGAGPQELTVAGGVLYFKFPSSSPRAGELWMVQGSPLVAMLVRQVEPDKTAVALSDLTGGGNQLFFRVSSAEEGAELWVSDSTFAGTRLLRDLVPGPGSGSGPSLKVIGKHAYFSGSGNGMSWGLWRSDGTEEGTELVKNAAGDVGSDPLEFSRVGDRVYFQADDGVHGRELWRTDGTEAGTVLVKDLRTGSASGVGALLGALDDNLLIFRANDGDGDQLWQSDGTELGTTPLSDVRIHSEHHQLSNLTSFADRVFYAVNGRLWCGQGMNAPAMTGAVTQVVGGFARVNNLVFFAGNMSGTGRELWRSDGTEAGTYLVRDIYSGSSSSRPSELTAFGGRCYFLAWNSSRQSLWRSDGSNFGTTQIPLGAVYPYRLKATVNGLYIYGTETVNDTQRPGLWVIRAGVWALEKLYSWPPWEPMELHFLETREENLFFWVRPYTSGPILWSSQGAPENTHPVAGGGVELPTSGAGIISLQDRLILAQVHETAGLEPHRLTLMPSWSLSVVNAEGSEKVLAANDQVAMAKQHPLREERVQLRLRNTGYLPIAGIQVTFRENAGGVFNLEGAEQVDLPLGADLAFSVVLNAPAPGAFEASLTVSHSTSDPAEFPFRVLGTIVAEGTPEFRVAPKARLALAGQPLSWGADFLGQEPITTTWLRNGRPIPGTVPLQFSAVALADAGSYALRLSNTHGRITSGRVALAVVRPAPPVAVYLEGETLTLGCSVQIPTGTKLSYQWYAYDTPLENGGRFSGCRSSRLRVAGMEWNDEGSEFDCRVTLSAGGRSETVFHGGTRVWVAERPVIDPHFHFPEVTIGEEVNLTLPSLNFASRFTAGGLPPGIKLNGATGQITGRPSRVPPIRDEEQLPFWVRLTAYNKAGRSETVTLPWYVIPLLPPGRHEGLLGREPALDGGKGFGSRVTLSATTRGLLTGRLFHEGRSYRFRSALPALVQHPVLGEVVGVSVKREASRSPLTLWVGTTYGNLETLGLSDGLGAAVAGVLRPSSFQRLETPSQRKDRYTVAFQAAGNPPMVGLPEGQGFLVATISRSGQARWSGQLADGTKVAGSSLVCGAPTWDDVQHIPFYTVPYQGLGSMQGWVTLSPVDDEGEFIEAEGVLDWLKHPVPEATRGRTYRSGIPLHTLTAQGGRYVPPRPEEAVFRLSNDPHNARMVLSGGGLPSLIVRSATLTSAVSGAGEKRRVELAPVWEGMSGMKMVVNAAAGTFSGELRMVDFNPTDPLRDAFRLTKFQGVLLPNQERAAGYFMLAQLPAHGPPSTTLANSPLVSGRVELIAANGTLSPEFVLLPNGTFQLGDSLNDGSSDELPVRSVTLNSFVIQTKEVTLEQWRAVMNWALNNGYDFDNVGAARSPNHPVQGINWYDAVKWCNARSEMERREPCYYTEAPFTSDRVYRSGKVDLDNSQFYFSNGPHYTGNGYRLPTEAEWERAARGGVSGGRFPQGATLSHDQANYFADPNAAALNGIDVSLTSGPHPVFGARGVPFSAPVGSFPANPAGLYDLSGNVAEWCWDWYAPYTVDPVTNPRVGDKPATDPKRVLRGGSGQSGAMQSRSSARDAAAPEAVAPSVGFRVVRRGL